MICDHGEGQWIILLKEEEKLSQGFIEHHD